MADFKISTDNGTTWKDVESSECPKETIIYKGRNEKGLAVFENDRVMFELEYQDWLVEGMEYEFIMNDIKIIKEEKVDIDLTKIIQR